MASNCFGVLRGQRMRITKVNSLGRVIYGPDVFVATKGFVRVNMQQQITEGETISLVSASGETCVSDKSPDSLDWINVTIDFCKVDISLFTLLNENFKALKNCYGEVAGFAESYTLAQESGFALEVWSDVQDYLPTDPNAVGAWLYWLVPFLVNARLGDETIENNAVTFQIVARTKKGSGWGVGPHLDIECQDPVGGECGPLLVPVDPNEPRRRLLVTCPPPPAICGAQPLSVADSPAITVAEAPGDAARRTVEVIPPVTGGPWSVNWGDGTIDAVLGADGGTHQYPAPVPAGSTREYTISVWATATPDKKRYVKVTVPYSGTVPLNHPAVFVSEAGSDPDGMTVSVLVNNHSNGTVNIDWGDGTADGTNPGDNATATTHAYDDDGTYTITVTDATDPTLTASRVATMPFDGGNPITASAAESSPAGPDRRTTTLTWDNQGQGPVTINWGDGTAVANGATAGTANHVYANAGTFNIVVTDATDADRTITVPVTVPYTA